MSRIVPIAALALALSSCAGLNDQPYYAVSGMRTDPLPGMQGEIISADGEPTSQTGSEIGRPTRRLLTFILLTPGASGNGSKGQKMDTGGPMARFDLTNGISPDDVQVNVVWDKKTDSLKIDGTNYDRSQGTLFVIVKSPRSLGQAWQLRSPSGTLDAKKALLFAKKELPDVKTLQVARTP